MKNKIELVAISNPEYKDSTFKVCINVDEIAVVISDIPKHQGKIVVVNSADENFCRIRTKGGVVFLLKHTYSEVLEKIEECYK